MIERAIRVLVVDDQELIRTGFALILATASAPGPGGEAAVHIVGEASNGHEALGMMQKLRDEGELPDVVLMDVRMPGMDGIEATARIAEDYPQVRVLVLTTFDLDEYALSAVRAGASGFLLKDARANELIGAVRAVADGDSVMAPSVTMRLIDRLRVPENEPERRAGLDLPTGVEQLTERELEVLRLIAEGLSNAEIGERLFLAESTVKTHVGRILAKLGLRDRVHAVIYAYEAGLR